MRVRRLGELLIEHKEPIGCADGGGSHLLGVSNTAGLHKATQQRVDDLSRYKRVERDWFAYNPMRINVGSLGWAHCDDLVGIISPDYVVFSCGPKIHSEYLFHFLASRRGAIEISKNTSGTVRERLYFKSLGNIEIPLPDYNEQVRIARLLTVFKDTVREVREGNESCLLKELPALRQAILQLAVLGKLVPQDPTDEPAYVVLAKRYDLPTGYKRKRKILKKTEISFDEAMFPPLPETWEYTSIQQLYDANVVIDYADGNHGSLYPRKHEFGDEGVLYVTARDIVDGRVNWPGCPRLKESKASELTKGWATGGDVLLTHNATVGRVARVEPDVGEFLLGTSVTFYRVNDAILDPNYFYFALLSPVWQQQLEAIMKQTTRNQVSIQKQAFFRIPFPPPNEQRHIVARLGRLMAACDELEAKLTQQQDDADRLTEAMVSAVLNGAAA